jgi:hypothetical protein
MIILIAIIAVAIILAFRGLVVMWLWNWLMPSILGLPEVSFLESIGLVFLAAFLFGTMNGKDMATATKKANKGT